MTKSISSIFPNPEALFQLEPEEVGAAVLEVLNDTPEAEKGINRQHFMLVRTAYHYPGAQQMRVMKTLSEGWGGWSGRG